MQYKFFVEPCRSCDWGRCDKSMVAPSRSLPLRSWLRGIRMNNVCTPSWARNGLPVWDAAVQSRSRTSGQKSVGLCMCAAEAILNRSERRQKLHRVKQSGIVLYEHAQMRAVQGQLVPAGGKYTTAIQASRHAAHTPDRYCWLLQLQPASTMHMYRHVRLWCSALQAVVYSHPGVAHQAITLTTAC